MDAYDVFVIRFESNVNRRYLPIPGLQRVFGIDQKTAEQIARNLPRVVKRRVTLEVAAQYAEALREIGAEVQLRPCENGSNLSQSTPPAARVSASSIPSPSAVSPSSTSEPSGVDQPQVAEKQVTPSISGDAPADADTSSNSTLSQSWLPSIETSASQIPTRSSQTTDAEVTQPQLAESEGQPVDDLSTRSSIRTDDDRVYRSSTWPLQAEYASLQGSSQPLALKQEQNVAWPAGVTQNKANLVPGAGNASSNSAHAPLNSNLHVHTASAARSTSAVGNPTFPLNSSPSSFPVNTPLSDEPIPPDSIKKSFWAPGVGYVLAGSVLIFIGLSYDGSIFTGNASISDYFFDALGVYWIGWGLFKLFKKKSDM